MSHTPGPWIIFSADISGPYEVLPAMRGGEVATCIRKAEDARLIAAAPAMLDALVEIEDMATDTRLVDRLGEIRKKVSDTLAALGRERPSPDP